MKWHKYWYRKTFNKIFTEDTLSDVKGLQVVEGEVFEKGTTYIITKEWQGWDYFGRGIYLTPKGISIDSKNPYWIENFNKIIKSGVWNKIGG